LHFVRERLSGAAQSTSTFALRLHWALRQVHFKCERDLHSVRLFAPAPPKHIRVSELFHGIPLSRGM
jgi:hypothetical protein